MNCLLFRGFLEPILGSIELIWGFAIWLTGKFGFPGGAYNFLSHEFLS
jgi:hypothetical protein